MSDLPSIRTAIPQRRYQVGEYVATLLGEVESGDRIEYRYILAFVEEGRGAPSLYVCCELNRPREIDGGGLRMRVVNSSMSELLEASDRWKDPEVFMADGLEVGKRMLGLGSEQVYPLSY